MFEPQFWLIGGLKFFFGDLNGVLGTSEQPSSGPPGSNGRYKQECSEQSYISIWLVENLIPPMEERAYPGENSLQNRHDAPKRTQSYYQRIDCRKLVISTDELFSMKPQLASVDRRSENMAALPIVIAEL